MPATNKLDFTNAQSAAKALKKVSTLMIRAGQPVVSSEFNATARRTSGITYREASLTVASGQLVVLRVNTTGDIFQVLLNGSVQPLKNQTDSDKAVGEIAALLEKTQGAFQKAQARKAIALPKGMSTPAPKQITVYAERAAQLDTQIAERQAKVADLQQQLGIMVDSLPPAAELNEAAKEVLVQLQAGAVEDGDLISKQGRDELLKANLVARDDGANWLTAKGQTLAAALLDSLPAIPVVAPSTEPEPMSWLGFKIVNQAFVDAVGPMEVPSRFQIGADVFLGLGQDGDKMDIAAKVIGANFRASKVHYTLAVPTQSVGQQNMYAVLYDVDSVSVASAGEVLLDGLSSLVVVESLDAYMAPMPNDAELTISDAYVAAREIVLADPTMMDSLATAGAIEQLRQALSVVETNAPINEAEGNLDQAALERSLAKSFTTAIAMLDSVSPDFGDSGLSELVNIAIVSAADVTDIKDQDALAQLLALGMVNTAEGLYMLTDKGRSALEDAGFDAYGEPFAAGD